MYSGNNDLGTMDDEPVPNKRGRSKRANSVVSSIHSSKVPSAIGIRTQSTANNGDDIVSPLTAKQIIVAIALCITGFFGAAMTGCLVPFFPTTAIAKGVSPTTIGFIFGIFSITEFVMAPVAGPVMGKVGARVSYMAAILFVGICGILFGFLDKTTGKTFVALCFVVRIGQAFGDAVLNMSIMAIIGTEYSSRINMFSGLYMTAMGIGMASGPAIGGILYHAAGFGLTFFVLGGAVLLIGLPTFFMLPRIEDSDTRAAGFVKLLHSPVAVALLLIIVVLAILVGALEPILEPYLKAQIGFMFFGMSMGSIFLSPIAGYALDKWGGGLIMIAVGAFFSGISYLIIGPAQFFSRAPSLPSVIVGMVVFGLFSDLVFTPTYPELLQAAKQQGYPDDFATAGLVSSAFQSCVYLGMFLGYSTSPPIAEHIGFRWTTAAFGLFSLCANIVLIIVLFVARRRTKLRGLELKEDTVSYGAIDNQK